ncbi:class I adenylate-forming enzyme family protein [Glycocaulis sp.]|uniref:class I adenylate-forming enzyme family protein n=1 Tax=Glycocaulis sp. TaxID=1969725 RepID=UPI003F716182
MAATPASRLEEYTAKGWWGSLTLDHLVQRNRVEAAGKRALRDPLNRADLDGKQPRSLSWAELGDEVDAMATALLEQGLRKGDVLTYQTPNFAETVILALAAARIGLVISPVVTAYREHELAYVLDTVKPKAVVTLARFAGFDHAALALKLQPSRGYKVLILGGDAPEGTVDLDAAMANASGERASAYAKANPSRPDETFTIFWTSGTEARPKGVPRDHNLWIVNARMVTEAADLQPGETVLNPFPLVNIGSFGLVTSWLWRAGVLVLHHPFDLKVFLQQIEAERVNYTIAAPAILNAILKTPELVAGIDLGSLRAIGAGSAPLAPWMIEGFSREYGIEVCNIYGSNEGASLFSSHLHVPDHADRARYFPRMGVEGIEWSGDIASMIQTRLVDLETSEDITEPGIPGELRFQGAATFSGYFGNPELTAAVFDEQGYYRTGDLFELAGDGPVPQFYRFVGRCKDIIVRGGVNISPAELDDLLSGHPDLAEAAVVGIPDEVLGERVCAAIVPRGDTVPALEQLTGWLREKGLAVFKLPEQAVRVDALPRNAMNKVVRSQLREQVLEKLGG